MPVDKEEKAVEKAGLTPEVLEPARSKCPRCKSQATYELDRVKGQYQGHRCCSCFHQWNEKS